jgi:RsiW-degrading membrane proteinase PrsW (M82 family)
MIEGLLAIPVLVPALFWAAYHYYKDRHLPEPPLNLATCFVLGVSAAWISKALYSGLGMVGLRYDAVLLADQHPLGLLLYAVLAIGPIEEVSKLLPFLVIAIRFRAFDDVLDGITYASFIALGYAAIENAYYLQFLDATEALARGFAGPVVHIAFASVWGYTIGKAKLAGQPLLRPALIGVGFSALLHGIYDFFALSAPHGSLIAAALIVAGLWMWRLVVIRRLRTHHATAAAGNQPSPPARGA